MSYITVLREGTRKARKPHQCFHCYRMIGVGETYGYQTNKYDEVYTLTWHIDCNDAATAYQNVSGWEDYDYEGHPPLRDMWCGSGEYQRELGWWRGEYPHVVCRMELTDQLRNARN